MKNFDWILILSLGIIWGASFFFNEVLLQTLSPLMIVYLRVLLASVFLVGIVIIKGESFAFTAKNVFNLAIMALLNNVIPFLLIVYGQQTITGGLASILNANTAFFALILAAMFLPNERLSSHRLVGVIIGLLGVIMAVGYENIIQFDRDGVGKYLVVLATLSYAFAGIWAKARLHTLSPMVSATGMLTLSTLILSPYALTYHGYELLSLNWVTFWYAMGTGILCTSIAYLLYFKILENTGAGNLLICTLIIPPSAIVLNAFILGQNITLTELYGLITISIGLMVLDGRITNRL